MCVFLYCLHKSNLFNVLDESAVREIAIHNPMDAHRPKEYIFPLDIFRGIYGSLILPIIRISCPFS
jgi:hypothetical protein